MRTSREHPHPSFTADPDQSRFLTLRADFSVNKIAKGPAPRTIWFIFKLDFRLNSFNPFLGHSPGGFLLFPFRRNPSFLPVNPLPLGLVVKFHAYPV